MQVNLPPINPPHAGNPIVVEDVVNVIVYKQQVYKRRRISAESVPANVLVHAAILEKQVTVDF
jgi:hypothetical protein